MKTPKTFREIVRDRVLNPLSRIKLSAELLQKNSKNSELLNEIQKSVDEISDFLK